MLGSESLSVRLAGIYSLEWLAKEDPEQYHIQIMQSFCSFALIRPEIMRRISRLLTMSLIQIRLRDKT